MRMNKLKPDKKILSQPAILWLLLMFLPGLLLGCTNLEDLVPTATPTREPSPTPSSCLVGIWEIMDPETYLRALVPVGAFEPGSLSYVDSVGSVAYRFDNQSLVTVEAVNLNGRFDVKEGIELNTLDIRLSGFASGSFKLEEGVIHFSELLSSNMQYSAVYLNEEMMTDVQADSFLPLFVEPYRTAQYTCSQQKLTLELINFPNIQKPIEFKRLR